KGAPYQPRFHPRHAGLTIIPSGGVLFCQGEVDQTGSTTTTRFPGIQARPSSPSGFIPVSVATGDFNGNGNADWVAAARLGTNRRAMAYNKHIEPILGLSG